MILCRTSIIRRIVLLITVCTSLHVSLGSQVLFVGGEGGWVEVGKVGDTAGHGEGADQEHVVQTIID